MGAVLTVLVEEKIGPGEQAERLVQTAKENLHFDYALALRSPATALFLALKMFKSEGGGGDGVLVSALSPRYYLRVIADVGMVPVVCDVDPASGCVTADLIRLAMEKSGGGGEPVRCIALYHSLALLPDMREVCELGIPLIEDCSTAYGATLGDKMAGSFGALSILGLEERDLLTAGGGALLFAMERRNAAALRNLPELPPEYRLPDMNAAMAIVQFREAARNSEKRSEIARLYADAAMRGRHKRFVHAEGFTPNNFAFPLILETGMKDVVAYAKKKDIAVECAFSGSIVGALDAPSEKSPCAYSLSLRTALFPMYPRLGPANAASIAKLILTLP